MRNLGEALDPTHMRAPSSSSLINLRRPESETRVRLRAQDRHSALAGQGGMPSARNDKRRRLHARSFAARLTTAFATAIGGPMQCACPGRPMNPDLQRPAMVHAVGQSGISVPLRCGAPPRRTDDVLLLRVRRFAEHGRVPAGRRCRLRYNAARLGWELPGRKPNLPGD